MAGDHSSGAELAQVLALGGLATLAGSSVLALALGQVAGALFGGGRPALVWEDAADVLLALPSHLHDPRAAYPLSSREGLPGPSGFYAAAALLLIVVVLVAASALRLVSLLSGVFAGAGRTGLSTGPGRAGPPSTAFASRRDLADLVVTRPEPGRVVLGLAHRRLIATEREHSVLVVGATRSGKTTGYAIPALLEWEGPAIVLSAKTDLLHGTVQSRRHRGEVLLFDPTRVSGLPGDDWSPLARCADWRGAVRTANAMSRVSGTTAGLGGASNHWERVAAQLLAPLLLAAAAGGRDMGDVVRWVMSKDLSEPKALLEVLDLGSEVALTSLQGYLDLEPRARDSAFSTARTVLDVYEDPDVVTATDGWDINPERLLGSGQNTLYLVANATDQTRLAPLFLALLDELLRSAFEAAAKRRSLSGSPFRDPNGHEVPRLLVLLDEAANIAPIPDLATLASTAGGEGVQLVTIYQDLSQLRHRYGTEWGSIASNHVAKVVLPGVTDPETLRYFASTVGEEEVLVRSTSRGSDGRRSTSESPQRRDVITQRELRQLPRGQGVCLYGSHPPIRFALRKPGERAQGS